MLNSLTFQERAENLAQDALNGYYFGRLNLRQAKIVLMHALHLIASCRSGAVKRIVTKNSETIVFRKNAITIETLSNGWAFWRKPKMVLRNLANPHYPIVELDPSVPFIQSIIDIERF